jgi:hypothetical protein
MQENYANYYEELELKANPICEGSLEYQNNIKCLKTTIAKLKTPAGAKEMQVLLEIDLCYIFFYKWFGKH